MSRWWLVAVGRESKAPRRCDGKEMQVMRLQTNQEADECHYRGPQRDVQLVARWSTSRRRVVSLQSQYR